MSVFKIKYLKTPGLRHVYCRLFASPSPNQTYASCGNFTVSTGEEWDCLQRAMSGVAFEDATPDGNNENARP